MQSLFVKRPNFTRPAWAASLPLSGFNHRLTKGSSRPPQPAQIPGRFGRVQTRVQHGVHPPTRKVRLTDVCRIWAARLSAPVRCQVSKEMRND